MTKADNKTKTTTKKSVKKTDKLVTKTTKTAGTSKKSVAVLENKNTEDLLSLSQKIEALQKVGLPKMRDNIVSAVLSVFEQISFIEEAEDIKDFVNTKINGIRCALGQAPMATDEYSYTLDDVETDIAKLRVALDKFTEENKRDEILIISQNISQIETDLKSLQNFTELINADVIRKDIRTINEELLSLSSRVNSMMLERDEIQNNIRNIANNVTKVENEYTDIKTRIDNVLNISGKNLQVSESTKLALTYLGEWVDGTSESFGKINIIKDNLDAINNKCPDHLKLISYLAERFAENEDHIRNLEEELTQIRLTINKNDDSLINDKIDNIEKQLARLTDSIEKLTSYVD